MLLACCSSGPSCSIYSDDFAADDLATKFNVRNGSWSIGSGVLTTGSANALLRAEAAGTTGHGVVSLKGKVDTAGGSFRLGGSYTDDSNYVFAEVTVNGASSTFKLWNRSAGSDTQLGSTYTFTGSLNTYYTICLDWDGSTANTSLSQTSACNTVIHDAFTGTGNKVVVGASPNGGTATFDDLSFSKHRDDDAGCPKCNCPSACGCSTVPAWLNAQISWAGNVCGATTTGYTYGGSAFTGNPGCVNGWLFFWDDGGIGATPISCNGYDLYPSYFLCDCQPFLGFSASGKWLYFFDNSTCFGVCEASFSILSCNPFHATITYDPPGADPAWTIELTE